MENHSFSVPWLLSKMLIQVFRVTIEEKITFRHVSNDERAVFSKVVFVLWHLKL